MLWDVKALQMDKRKTRNRICIIGIIWIMVNMVSFNSYAKASFSKSQPLGIMSTAVKKEIAVSWEAVKGADGYEVYEAVETDCDSQEESQLDDLDEKEKQAGSYYLVRSVKKSKVILKGKQPGKVYSYYVRAYQIKSNGKKSYSRASKKVSTTVAAKGISTVKNLLQTAIAPIGCLLYTSDAADD